MIVTSDSIQKIGDLAAGAGIRRVHVLAWRDLDDVEAGGSEVHASEVARHWAEAGIEVVMRTSYAQGHPPRARRDGYEVVRKAGRYLVFPRAALAEVAHRYGHRDALVEIWNGMPFFSPLWAKGPRVVFLHHVHADMWKMALPPNLARIGDTVESRLAPRLYRGSRMITLSPSSKEEMLDIGFRSELVEVVAPGLDPRFSPGGTRSRTPLVVGVGRLMPVKPFVFADHADDLDAVYTVDASGAPANGTWTLRVTDVMPVMGVGGTNPGGYLDGWGMDF